MKIFLLLIYLMAGNSEVELKVDKIEVKNVEACVTLANKTIEAQYKDPRFVRGIFADCIEVESRQS